LTRGKTESQGLQDDVAGLQKCDITAFGTRMIDQVSKEKHKNLSPKDARAERLAEVLRANLKRRKEAARDRMGGKDDTKDE
jgi:hypothetical protein